MDSRQAAEQLPSLAWRIHQALRLWQAFSDWSPGPLDIGRAKRARADLAALIAKATIVDYLLGEEIAAAEKPDVLAGAEGS